MLHQGCGLFYATDTDIPWEVAIFETEQERNDWLAYRDYDILHLLPDARTRVAITYDKARNITCDRVLDVDNFISDEVFDHIKYCTGRPRMGMDELKKFL